MKLPQVRLTPSKTRRRDMTQEKSTEQVQEGYTVEPINKNKELEEALKEQQAVPPTTT